MLASRDDYEDKHMDRKLRDDVVKENAMILEKLRDVEDRETHKVI